MPSNVLYKNSKWKEGKEDNHDNHNEKYPKKKCSHCGRIGHEESLYFYAHPELKKKFTQQKEYKDKEVSVVSNAEKKDDKSSKHIVYIVTSSRAEFEKAFNLPRSYAEVISGVMKNPETLIKVKQEEPSTLKKELNYKFD